MSDYFGALMNLSGLGDRARGPVAPANAPDAGGDIVESEVVREAVATPAPGAEQHGPASMALPIAGSAAAESAAAESAATESAAAESAAGHLPMLAPAAADLRPAEPAPARRITSTEVAPATANAVPMAAEPRHAVIRAALEWVASDPHNIADRRDIAEAQDIVAVSAPAAAKITGMSRPSTVASARAQPASPTIEEVEIVGIGTAPRMEIPHRLLVADVETATTRTSSQTIAVPSARIVGTGPTASGRVAPVTVADETVEISIGAIHVRVDAPVPQAPSAPAPRMPSERSAASSALSRRALRRF
jgi:hypothetical protein